jgi:hypothetical protein
MRLPKTINIQIGHKDEICCEVLKCFHDVLAVQVGYDIVHVTFSTQHSYSSAKSLNGVYLYDMWCTILGGGPLLTMVHMFDYPYEGDEDSVKKVFSDFGDVKWVKCQTYVSNPTIFTGTRLVSMVLSGSLPRSIMIDGYLC